MSFGKAKIIRFNDVNVGTPSTPAKDTPVKKPMSCEKSKIKLCESPAISDSGSVTGSVKSMPSKFKTPNLPKKLKTVFSSNKIKPKDLFPTQNDLEALREKTVECENKTKYIQELTDEIDQIKNDLQDVKKEKELLQREHQKELEDIEFEMLKTMTKLQNQEEEARIKIRELDERMNKEIANLKIVHKKQICKVESDLSQKIVNIQSEAETNLLKKVQEVENEWNEKLIAQKQESDAILKECQAISEYNIIQCELEKKEVQYALDKMTQEYEELTNKYNDILSKKTVSFVEADCRFEDKIDNLNEKLIKKEEEIKTLQSEIKAYQITINTSQVTIEVLTKRLMNSDRDVEVLKSELEQCEAKMLEYEGKYWRIFEELKEARNDYEDLEMQYESAIKMNETSINQTKSDLLKKILNYELEVKKYSRRLDEVHNYKDYVSQQMDFHVENIKAINLKLDSVEEDNIQKEKEIEELKQSNELLRNDVKDKNNLVKDLKVEINNLNEKCEDLDKDCEIYKCKVKELQSNLEEDSQNTKKYIDLSGKYDLLFQKFETMKLEHSNYKTQVEKEIKDFREVKIAFENMKKEKELLEVENNKMKIRLEDHKFKKLKFSAKDKENIGSPNRSLIESPNRASPFRERN